MKRKATKKIALLTTFMLSATIPFINSYASEPQLITIKGFELPETVLHDPREDVYLVSNISGKIPAKDDNGFISKVGTNGKVIDLKWIDGASKEITLHSPKGIAVHGNNIYVADIDTIRVFNRKTGKQLKDISIPGTTFLNDIVATPNGELYVSESAIAFKDGGFKATNLDAIYKITSEGNVTKWAEGVELNQPNGLEVLPGGELGVVTRGSNNLYVLDKNSKARYLTYSPGKILDGIVRLPNGEFLTTSWETSKLYRLTSENHFIEEASLPVPAANIGYDYRRKTLLLPLLKQNSIAFMKIE